MIQYDQLRHPLPDAVVMKTVRDAQAGRGMRQAAVERARDSTMLELRVAVAKVPRADADESGDTLEMVERPGGGFSFVLVDGQGTGRGAKTLSNLVITRAIAQLKDGARDGVVARAVHDYLYTYRMGQVAATLNILSIDFQSGSILVTRNNPAPFFVLSGEGVQIHSEPSTPIGLHPMARPRITEVPVRAYTYVVIFTDGLLKAGERYGEDLELVNFLSGWRVDDPRGPQGLADALLGRAIELDRSAPSDDMSVLALAVLPTRAEDVVRRLQVCFPMQRTTIAEPRELASEDDLG